MIQHLKTILGFLAIVLSITFTIDLIFYWPESGYDLFYLGKLIVFIISGAFISWVYLLKSKFNKSIME